MAVIVLLNISKLLLLSFRYIYIYRFLYDYIGKHIHLINSITGMNRLKINIVIITVFLELHLAHYLIGTRFLT